MAEASPGRIEPSEGLHGLRLTEWSDASDFHMEFVELAWFPLAAANMAVVGPRCGKPHDGRGQKKRGHRKQGKRCHDSPHQLR